MARTNDDVVQRLEELARLTVVDEGDPNSFRVRAYQNAARAVDTLEGDVRDLSASQLAQVRGIGKSTAAKIRQFVDEGRIDKLEQLREKYPPGQLELMKVPGLGPKTVQLLAEVLDVRDLDGLKAALDDGRLAKLPGLGEKTAANLATAIERMHLASKEKRRPIHEVMPVAESLVGALADRDDVERVAYAGSLRRFRETIGDVDVLVAARSSAGVMDAFTSHDTVHEVVGRGETKSSVVTHDGLQVDLRVVAPEAFGAALVYFTGSKAHNIRLRQRAIARGWKLSEYTLEDAETGEVVAATTEQDVYAALGLACGGASEAEEPAPAPPTHEATHQAAGVVQAIRFQNRNKREGYSTWVVELELPAGTLTPADAHGGPVRVRLPQTVSWHALTPEEQAKLAPEGPASVLTPPEWRGFRTGQTVDLAVWVSSPGLAHLVR